MSEYDPSNPSSGVPDTGVPGSNSNALKPSIKLNMLQPPLFGGNATVSGVTRNRIRLQADTGTMLPLKRSSNNNRVSGTPASGPKWETCNCKPTSKAVNSPQGGGRILYDDPPPPLDPTDNGPSNGGQVLSGDNSSPNSGGGVIVVVDQDWNVLTSLTIPPGSNQGEWEAWLKRMYTPIPHILSPQNDIFGDSGDPLGDYQKQINDQLSQGWNDAPPLDPYIDPDAFQNFQDRHKKETPIDKGREANAGNSTYNDDGCELAWGIGLGAHENAYNDDKLPLESDEKLWEHILDPSGTGLLSDRPWKATDPGMGQFLEARDKFLEAGKALKQLKQILDSKGVNGLRDEIANELTELYRLSFDGTMLKIFGTLTGFPLVGLIGGILSSWSILNKVALIGFLTTLQNLDVYTLEDLFKKMYEVSYRQMVLAYAKLISSNRRDPKSGAYLHKLCDDDQRLLNDDIIPKLHNEINDINSMFPYRWLYQDFEEIIPNAYLPHNILPNK